METVLRKWTKTPSRHSCRLYRAVVLDDTEARLQNNWSSEPQFWPTHSTHTEQLHFTTQRALTLHWTAEVCYTPNMQWTYLCSASAHEWQCNLLRRDVLLFTQVIYNSWFLPAVDNKMGEKILALKARPEHSRDQISSRFEGGLFLLWPVSNLATT